MECMAGEKLLELRELGPISHPTTSGTGVTAL